MCVVVVSAPFRNKEMQRGGARCVYGRNKTQDEDLAMHRKDMVALADVHANTRIYTHHIGERNVALQRIAYDHI